MISPPPAATSSPSRALVWSGFARRFALLIIGLACFAFGISCTFKAALGLGPWDCFHRGLNAHLPITVGQASILTAMLVLGVAMLLGVRPGLGTLCDMVLVGSFLDGYNAILPDFAQAGLPVQIGVDVLGVLIIGLGSGMYIKARLGAGPRDSLMLALSRRTGQRIALMRGAVEIVVFTLGVILGVTATPTVMTAGLGTIIFALGIGPAVELGFRLLRVDVARA
jgi:uncharacterized membrane protein YczE